MSNKVELALGLSLAPICGGKKHTVEQKESIAILRQQIGKCRPMAQQRLVCHLESSRVWLCRSHLLGQLHDQQSALRECVGERHEVGRQLILTRNATLRRFAFSVN